jgi:hypothetical protein
LEVLRQRDLLKKTVADMEQELEIRKLEPLAKSRKSPPSLASCIPPLNFEGLFNSLTAVSELAGPEEKKPLANTEHEPVQKLRLAMPSLIPHASMSTSIAVPVTPPPVPVTPPAVPANGKISSSNSDSSGSDSDQSSVFDTGISHTIDASGLIQKNKKGQYFFAHADHARRKGKLPEIPRLRNRFHDYRVILREAWMYRVQTRKRYHLDVAEQLGLSEEDFKVRDIYKINIEDLMAAAEEKDQRKMDRAAAKVQAFWRAMQVAKLSSSEAKRRLNAIKTLQRWWRRHLHFILPVKTRLALRPIENAARAKIGAWVLGWWCRKKLRLQRDCHSIKYQMNDMQKQLESLDYWRFMGAVIRIQGRVRGNLARRRAVIKRRLLFEKNIVTKSSTLGALENPDQSASSPNEIDMRRSTVCASDAGLEQLHKYNSPKSPLKLAPTDEHRSSPDQKASSTSSSQKSRQPRESRGSRASSKVKVPSSTVNPAAPIATLAMYSRKQTTGQRITAAVPLSVRRRGPLRHELARIGGLRTDRLALTDIAEADKADEEDEFTEPSEPEGFLETSYDEKDGNGNEPEYSSEPAKGRGESCD